MVIFQTTTALQSPDLSLTGYLGHTALRYHQEKSWMEVGSWAPYQNELDDGRKIFAPSDQIT
jgi:hypothetical protein